MHRLLALLFFSLASFAPAQTTIEFWHSQDATESTVDALAEAFNQSQSDYRVVPLYTGGYGESAVRLVAALASGTQPALFDAEGTVLARLAEEGSLADLSELAATLPEETVADFFPVLWAYGDWEGARYGLPWNLSMPVLFYNASIFRSLGLTPPTTWEAFEAAAARLTTRNTTGYIDVAVAFSFEAMVSTRGGRLVGEDGQPTFTTPEAIDALSMLTRMAEQGHSIPRSFGQVDAALIDFARTKAMMAIASIAFWPQGERFSVAFDVAAAPVPTGVSNEVPVMGAELVTFKNSSAAERRGAFEFWKFLMEPENLKTWVEASYFLPVRRSALPLLEPWYEEDPSRRAALSQLENGILRPRTGAYAIWQGYLEEALEKAVRGQMSPEAALAEAQQRALESR